MDLLSNRRRDLEGTLPIGRPVLQRLEKDQCEITHIRQLDSAAGWFVRIKPPDSIRDAFGLGPEVLLLLVNGEVQARDLTQARDEVARSGLRLDGNLLLVADIGHQRGLRPLQLRLSQIGGNTQRVAITPSTDGAWPSLLEALKSGATEFDAYQDLDPVRGAQVVGRGDEISRHRTSLARGDAVALLGLRKMGKTSVMRAATDWFDPASGMRERGQDAPESGTRVALVIDAGTVLDKTADGVADEFLAALRRRMRAASEEPQTTGRGGLHELKSQIELLIDASRPVAFVIDEFDLLFESETGQPAPVGISRLFRLIRGWSQSHQGMVSLLLVGRDPTLLSRPEMDGVTSPLLAWCNPEWLGPLNKEQGTELIRKLGRRVGLVVGPRTAETSLFWTGGHPLLQRQFGSALREAVRRSTQSWAVPTDDWDSQALDIFRQREVVLDVCRETQALLQSRYPASWELLSLLASGVAWTEACSSVGGVDSEAARTIERFGLAGPERRLPEAWAMYVRDLASGPRQPR
jgi:hypothetical protein